MGAVTVAKVIGTTLAPVLPKALDYAINKKQEQQEKSFFDENKSWIYMIILAIFTVNLNYFNMFEQVILNSIINIIYGIMMCVLLVAFLKEKKGFLINSKFLKTVSVVLIILSTINSCYHVGYAIYNLFI